MNLIYKILSMPHFAGPSCSGHSFFGIPTWYQYLSGTTTNGVCAPKLGSISDVWLIVAAVIEILLKVAALAAVGIIIYAGVEYTTSQGNPERTGRALNTIIGAAIGLVICILSAALVTFIAESFK
jgi:ABC-type Fe3+ transport system permease subunit